MPSISSEGSQSVGEIDSPTLPSLDSENSVAELQAVVTDLRQRNDALADAVVNSAEIIDELEQTKRQLAEAQTAAERAHQNTQRLAETIFEGTSDAMMVLDLKFNLVAANHKARSMFELQQAAEQGDHGVSLAITSLPLHLSKRFDSQSHGKWFDALTAPDSAIDRVELFRCTPEPLLEINNGGRNQASIRPQWIEVSVSKLPARAGYLLTAHDITRRKKLAAEFKHQALHDKVTRLPNRRFFVNEMQALLSDPKQPEFVVCFLDLDHFKTVNDTLGHEAGDQLLIQVAGRIRARVRDDCFLARFGGDEFAILCPGFSPEAIETVSNRIVNELSKPFSINNNEVYISASIGITRYPADATDAESLLQNADVAMYSAKDGGRNCFHEFTPELAGRIRDRKLLLDDLRVSLEQQDIALEYQPKWCMRENRFAGSEALLRWKRSGQLVRPAKLVEAAECSGLILPLGDLVIETALQQMVSWEKEDNLSASMAVNVSPHQFADPNFLDRFRQILDSFGVSPSLVELEITETAMVNNFNRAFESLSEFRKLGVSIAIDDFGTGYSSLSYLKSFPVTTLKIDRSFVSDLPNDPKAVAVAEAILALAHGLELKVVAEGVETIEQYRFLKDAGCDQMQGFLLSASLPPNIMPSWLQQQNGILTGPEEP